MHKHKWFSYCCQQFCKTCLYWADMMDKMVINSPFRRNMCVLWWSFKSSVKKKKKVLNDSLPSTDYLTKNSFQNSTMIESSLCAHHPHAFLILTWQICHCTTGGGLRWRSCFLIVESVRRQSSCRLEALNHDKGGESAWQRCPGLLLRHPCRQQCVELFSCTLTMFTCLHSHRQCSSTSVALTKQKMCTHNYTAT